MVLSCISAPGNKHSFSARSWPLNGPLLHYGWLFYVSTGKDEIATYPKLFKPHPIGKIPIPISLSNQNDRADFVSISN
jgi:hypothetical protein